VWYRENICCKSAYKGLDHTQKIILKKQWDVKKNKAINLGCCRDVTTICTNK